MVWLQKAVRSRLFAARWLLALFVTTAPTGVGAVEGHAQERVVNIGVLTDMSGLYKDLSGEFR